MGVRLDVELVNRGLADTRARAQQLVAKGAVVLNGRVAEKPSARVEEGDELRIADGLALRYVSRGGEKLERALAHFGLSVEGRRVLDIGSSTGGFTHCALQHGAAHVYAVDVGTEQLHESLRGDGRISLHENTHIRDLTLAQLDGCPVDCVVCDVSFISLVHIFTYVRTLLAPGGWAVLLIKPQFEVGRGQLPKDGVVKGPKAQASAIEACLDAARGCGLQPLGLTHSPLGGRGKNTEYLLHLVHAGAQLRADTIDVPAAVQEARRAFNS
ncbi:MAG: TlyA family rRNA (cytidine-2'-O)-methyltransferase [Bacteroidia bacterium]|nr:MAG: TlyA family rRNA (cytidine-2'-O)-methyltransferase [Bacteroidia bacterium]